MGNKSCMGPTMRVSAVRFLSVAWLLVVLTALSSCGQRSNETPLFPATGELFVGDQPGVGAQLAFWPAQESADRWPSGYPRAVVDQAGKFVVETFGAEDGCPEGDYTVLVIWPAASSDTESGGDAETVDRLGGRYSTRETSPLKAKVEAKPTDLGRYQLK
jgi:hypothetical protein